MSLSINNYVLFFTIICYIHIVRTVVPDYCLQPLNSDDCGAKPTAVMTYWKPGSRCEIDIWRGCPTVNKFEDEYNCSLTCIFNAVSSIDECEASMDESKCNEIEQVVYTYRNGLCELTVWRGCPTINKFINRTACINTCGQGQWQEKIEKMPIDKLQLFDKMLGSLVNANNTDSASIESNEVGLVIETSGDNETTTEQDNGAEEVTEETATDQEESASEEPTTEAEDHSTESPSADPDTTEPPTTETPTTEPPTTEPPTTTPNSIDEVEVITA